MIERMNGRLLTLEPSGIRRFFDYRFGRIPIGFALGRSFLGRGLFLARGLGGFGGRFLLFTASRAEKRFFRGRLFRPFAARRLRKTGFFLQLFRHLITTP